MDDRLTDLAVRCARAEIERDAAYDELREAQSAMGAFARRLHDPEGFAETLRICGIPAKDLADIYRTQQDWRRAGGRDGYLSLLRELYELREYKATRERIDASLADAHRVGG